MKSVTIAIHDRREISEQCDARDPRYCVGKEPRLVYFSQPIKCRMM
jgi:hypothetical protein